MGKFGKGFGAVGGFLVGSAVVLYGVNKILEEEPKKVKEKTAFEKLIEKQKVCDIADVSMLTEWFREYEQKGAPKPVFFIAKPTEHTSKMFALGKIPRELNCEHSLLQAVINGKSMEVKAIRLISFSSLQKEITQLFGDKDYVIVEGDKNE